MPGNAGHIGEGFGDRDIFDVCPGAEIGYGMKQLQVPDFQLNDE
jgi:hypothetical protein